MAVFDFTEAVSFVGRTVLVELAWDDEPVSFWHCVFVAGVVFSVPGVYEHPHFMVFPVGSKPSFPDEFMWSDIKTIAPMGRALRVR